MALIASPIQLNRYIPATLPIGDAAETIAALKGSGSSLLGQVQNLQPQPLQVEKKVSPDTSVQLETSGSQAVSPEWEAQGVTPPEAWKPEFFLGHMVNKVREAGPDWKTRLLNGG